MKLIFQNSSKEERVIAEPLDLKEVREEIKSFLMDIISKAITQEFGKKMVD